MLRECPNCGGRVTDKAVRCVHCGFCYKICPECDELIGAEEACCPSCGYLFALPDPEGKPEKVAAVVRENAETPSEGKPVELVPKPSPAVYAERGPVNYLKTNRGLIKYLIFSALTLGIYAFYFIHAVSREVNCVCEGDGKKTRGFFLYMLFTALTFGIYYFVWGYSVCNRMDERIRRTGKISNVTGGSWFMWTVFGTLLFGVGPLVAEYKLIHGLNEINGIYNREGGSRTHVDSLRYNPEQYDNRDYSPSKGSKIIVIVSLTIVSVAIISLLISMIFLL